MIHLTKTTLAIICLIALTSSLRAQPQFRAVWADIFHNGMQNAAQVDTMVNTLAAAHYNVVIVQVLGYMDQGTSSHGAYWKSSIVPWSGYVTGSFDPLAYLCTKAHASGIEVHAWLGGSGGGPYRVSTVWPPSGNATLAAHPEWFMVPLTNSESGTISQLDGSYLLDMGSPDAQDYIISIVKELVTNYPIDGINWDDEVNGTGYNQGYGYPCYAQANYSKSGLARYRINTGASGTPSNTDVNWSNYRRRFKGELMARCQAEIESIKTNPRQPLRHTSAPEAYSPVPTTCNFSTTTPYINFVDWAGMLQNGWIDAAIPQTYSVSTFTNWVSKCASCWQYNRAIFPGLGGYLNTNAANLAMMQYAYSTGLQGTSIYSYMVPNKDGTDWFSYVAANLYTNVVATPTMPWRNPATATEGIMWGKVTDYTTGLPVDDATVTVTGGSTVKTDGNGYYIATLVPATSSGTVHQLVASKTGMTSATNTTATAVAADVKRYDLTLNIPARPAITAQPSSKTVGAGTNVTFSVTASGSGLSYQWQKNTANLSNTGSISGATTANLTIGSATTSDAASYTVIVSNAGGSTTSSVATLTVVNPPAITSQPQSDTSLQGQSVFFTVSASGSAPLSYHWKKNAASLTDGSNVSGSTTSALTIRSASPTDVASYTVIVSNIVGVSVTSSAATLTIVSNVIPLVGMASNSDGSISLTWQTDSGTSYTLQAKSSLTDLTWTTLNNYTASSSTLIVTDSPIAGTQRFYQLTSSQRASDPAGFIKVSALGNSDTFVSLPFARPGGTRIIVSSVSGNTITADGSPNWSDNQFVYSSGTQPNTYYARFSSGALEGRIYQITANTADTLTLSIGSDSLLSVAAADTVAIEPYWTLNTVFPNGDGIIASPTPGNRYTELLLPNAAGTGVNLSASRIYYFNAGIWKQVSDGSNNHNDDILQPNSHFIARHNVATNSTVTTLGSVITSKLAIALAVQPATLQDNYIGLARPVPMSLNDCGLISSGAFSASPLPGSRTDELLIFDNSAIAHNKSASADYYYWSNAWRQVGAGSTDVGTNLVFQPATAVIIRKATNNVSPVWTNAANW